MRLSGNLLPFIGRVISPCDANGIPAMTDEEAGEAHFETTALCLAWFGRVIMIGIGAVGPRAVDPDNPRAYLAGNL
ncbi:MULTISPECIES: hypothetical protein [unclassified Aureimonas]|uniref:hypothetical protein n=1 Tax=unclassified Aureimonas TaxID=2615206 RepID=UPI000701AD59|nr:MULTISPECIES: hypothetical protein [unclassified Aureimonas]KQT52203.1 hypothetical protein ASG62_16220 [Aureimonas sp. Leaf427]KQT70564.1 hypothetical protein ASG54_21730 [Aureimonas sp. Leaf460]